MQGLGTTLKDAATAVAGLASGLFGQESQRGGLAHHAQFAVGLVLVRRIQVDAAVQKRAVEISHQRTYITGGIILAFRALAGMEPLDGLARGLVPVVPVAFVDGIDVPLLGNAHVRMGKQEFPDTGVQREAVHPLAGTEHKHGGRTIQDISRGHLLHAGLQDFPQGDFPGAARRTAQDGKDGAHVDVDINVGRTIKRIEDKDVIPTGEFGPHTHQFRLFLGAHGTQGPATLHAVQKDAIGDAVHLLDVLALDVHFARAAKDIQQTGFVYPSGDGLPRQDQVIQKTGELAGGLGGTFLVQQKVFGNGNVGHEKPPCTGYESVCAAEAAHTA